MLITIDDKKSLNVKNLTYLKIIDELRILNGYAKIHKAQTGEQI